MGASDWSRAVSQPKAEKIIPRPRARSEVNLHALIKVSRPPVRRREVLFQLSCPSLVSLRLCVVLVAARWESVAS